MDPPIIHDSDRYELVRDIGSGNFGVARLMRDKQTGEQVAVKYIERGEKVGVSFLCLLLEKFDYLSFGIFRGLVCFSACFVWRLRNKGKVLKV